MSAVKTTPEISGRAVMVLSSSTVAFTICFAVWMMFAVIGIPIKKMLGLNETEFGLLAAMPVLTGSLVRVPLGVATDKFGGRMVMFFLMLSAVIPIYLISYATAFWEYLTLGLFVGMVGGTFSVGTPYVARWFPRNRQGFAMGVFGAGNSGAALNKFVAPVIIASLGWQMVPRIYAVAMLVTAFGFLLFSASDPSHRVSSQVTLRQQMSLLRDPRVLRYCQYYSVVFGGYVALALWMTKYYVSEFNFSLHDAALLAACFSLPGGVLRALGGWISDRYGAYRVTWAVMWVIFGCLFLLSYPTTHMVIETVKGPLSIDIAHTPLFFTILLFTVGVATAIGKASVFKFVSDDYPENIGAVSGIVGLAGGLAGFILPIMFGALVDLTGIRSSCFMLLFGTVCVSMIWTYFAFRQESCSIEVGRTLTPAESLEN